MSPMRTVDLSRRSLLLTGLGAGAGLLAAPAILRAEPLPAIAGDPFRLGIASGEPAPDGFVIWTRLAPDPLAMHGGMPSALVPVQWEVAADEGFATILRSGEATAWPELAHSVHVEVDGLAPDRRYWYRFHVGRATSPVGRARTAPLPSARPAALRIGVCGCQNYEQGLYTAYRHLAAEEIDFVYHYGDYIYEGRSFYEGHVKPPPKALDGTPLPIVREHLGLAPLSLDDYRRRYAQYKLDPDLQAAHRAAPFVTVFDDHEVDDDWAGDHDLGGSPPEIFRLRRAAAFQAWYEHTPLRRAQLPSGDSIRINRTLRWGDLVDMHLLDTRQFRTPQPCGDGFKACAAREDPAASFMGLAQERWLAAALRRREARWNAIAQEVMMMDLDRRTADGPEPTYNLDSWAGYARPRKRVLDMMRGLGNVVVLTGDEHQNYAGTLMDAGKPVAVEFVGTSISSGGDGIDHAPASARILADNPQLALINSQRGYLICTVGREEWRTEMMVVDQVRTPGGRLSRRASFVVPRGEPALSLA